jgi:hypothetical protein
MFRLFARDAGHVEALSWWVGQIAGEADDNAAPALDAKTRAARFGRLALAGDLSTFPLGPRRRCSARGSARGRSDHDCGEPHSDGG